MEFLQNKYTNWYIALVNRRQITIPSGYSEKHHIIPKSLGGTNELNNIVRLTAREHFVSHKLLIRMTTGHERYKMINALWLMSTEKSKRRNFQIPSREYAWLKLQKSLYMTGKRHSPERIERNRQIQKIVQNKPEVRAKKIAALAKPEVKARQSANISKSLARPEVRNKLRLKHNKPIVQINRISDQVINVYPSGKEAERATKISRSHISSVVHGNRSHAGGFSWQLLINGEG